MQASGELIETIGLQRVDSRRGRDGSNIGIEVVDTTRAFVGDGPEGYFAQDRLAVADKLKPLDTNLHIDCVCRGPSGSVKFVQSPTRVDKNGTGGGKERHDEHAVGQCLVSIRAPFEIVSAGIISRHHGGIRGVTVQSLGCDAIPVDELVGGDVARDVGRAGLVSGNERLGEIKPSIVGHVVGPLRVSVVIVGRGEGADVVRLAVVIPCDDFHELWLKSKDLLPALVPEKIAREDPVFAIRHFGAIMSREPGGDSCSMVRFNFNVCNVYLRAM